jgi:hypothetical protein
MVTETQLLLAPQLKAMLDSEAYHYCADCHTHCRQTILAVEAAKEVIKAHASDVEQLSGLRKAATEAIKVLRLGFPGSLKRKAVIAQLERAVLTPQEAEESK